MPHRCRTPSIDVFRLALRSVQPQIRDYSREESFVKISMTHSWCTVSLLLAMLLPSARGEAETGEALLEKINQLPAKERQAALVQGARKEGVVVWYAGMNQANLREFTGAFESEYPFLKVKPLTIGGTRLFNRALAEYRAGKYEYDVINVRSSRLHSLKKAKAVMRYKTPYRQALKAGFYDQDGYFNGIWASVLVFLYNTKLLPRAEVPRSLEALLQPKWRGQMAMDDDADDWMAAVLEYYGEEKGKQLAKRIGDQNLQMRHGRSLLVQLVAAGEFPFQIDAHQHEVIRLRDQGAPIDYVFPEPFIPLKSVSAFTLASHAPHPHAAALLVDFMLSKKGQEIAQGQDRWPAHKMVSQGGPDDVGERKIVVPNPDKWGPRFDELVNLVRTLLIR
jgi:iron(III) transport system substrate-binding protein